MGVGIWLNKIAKGISKGDNLVSVSDISNYITEMSGERYPNRTVGKFMTSRGVPCERRLVKLSGKLTTYYLTNIPYEDIPPF